MSNTLAIYDPLFYANEALIALMKALGLAGRVHRGYDATAQQKGSTINISRPSTFTAQDAPSSAQDIQAGTVAVTLDQWKEVKFKLSDKELTFTKEKIITDHIEPAAYALADAVDVFMAGKVKDFYTQVAQAGATLALADVAAVYKAMFDNKVPMKDLTMLHLMIDGKGQADLLPVLAPNTMSGNDQSALRSGALGRLLGLDVFANQNTPTTTSTALTAGAATANGVQAVNVGSTDFGKTGTLSIAKATNAADLVEGDIITIAGDSQQYVIREDVTLAVGNTTVKIAPALQVATAGGEAITLVDSAGVQQFGFHRNALALATAPLSTMGGDLGGARIESIADPVTGLSIRSRVFYMPDASEVRVALDILYGGTILDRALGVRLTR